jgi:hypothetical protein
MCVVIFSCVALQDLSVLKVHEHPFILVKEYLLEDVLTLHDVQKLLNVEVLVQLQLAASKDLLIEFALVAENGFGSLTVTFAQISQWVTKVPIDVQNELSSIHDVFVE